MDNEKQLSRLKQERLKRGWPLQQVAIEIGCTATTISNWENGLSLPDVSNALALSRLYGVSVHDLFMRTKTKKLRKGTNQNDETI